MKICDVVQFYSPLSGGVKRYIHDKMRYFSSVDGVEHVVVVPSHHNYDEVVEGSRIYHIKSLPLVGSRSYRMLLSRRRIEEIAEWEQPDIIEVGDPYRSAWIALAVARRYGIPVVAYYHSDYPRALGRTIRRFAGPRLQKAVARPIESYLYRLYARMDATVVATSRVEHILRGFGVPRLVRVPLGTNVDVFRPMPSRENLLRSLRLPPSTRLLLYVGRIAREKNIKALLDMLPLLADIPDVHLLVVGDGEQCRKVRRQARLNPRLSWLPYCGTPEDLAKLYSAAELLVHAGIGETFGLAALEAQACGTRAMGVRNGGLDDALEGEEPPIMADTADPADLAAAVRQALLLDEPADAPERRRERVVASFSWTRTYERMLALYRRLSAAGPLAPAGVSNEEWSDVLYHPSVCS